MRRLFEGLKTNTHLEYLSLANVDLYDASAEVKIIWFIYLFIFNVINLVSPKANIMREHKIQFKITIQV